MPLTAPFAEQHFISLKIAEQMERAALPDVPMGRPDIGDALPGSLPQMAGPWFSDDVLDFGVFPGPANTGVSAGITLTEPALDVDRNYNSLGPDTIIENFEIFNGTIVVNHLNVTIRNCRIHASEVFGFSVFIANNKTGTIIEDCEIIGSGSAGIYQNDGCTGMIVRRNDITRVADGFHIADGSITIEDNYIHDLWGAGDEPHIDGVQCSPLSANVTIRHNNFNLLAADPVDVDQGPSAGIQFDLSPGQNNTNWLVEDNRVVLQADGPSPGAITIRLPSTDQSTHNLIVRNNHLGAGFFGYIDGPALKNNITEWSGNVDYVTGVAI